MGSWLGVDQVLGIPSIDFFCDGRIWMGKDQLLGITSLYFFCDGHLARHRATPGHLVVMCAVEHEVMSCVNDF
ncbi:hypothetical protein OWV82_024327 [Melia azedarach]|uniref:Uncharacterized protein n=1 Tax=Melia azedarach TaxID=155640 RepID=A0ACC1WPU5_MELAZ|nr:hypothetical protein OWV82_024327 [Melia azedarach]